MTPEQSEAKAREILAQLINALGGSSFMEVQERECVGRRANIGHSGELAGYVEFKDYWRYPDKHRIDYSKKGNIIDMYNGDEGWTLDRSGVSEEPVTAMADFQDSVKRNIDNLLRLHLRDKGVYPRYGGMDLVDLRQVDWVEFNDVEAERKQRLAVDHSSHLLLRSEITTVDPNFNQRTRRNHHLHQLPAPRRRHDSAANFPRTRRPPHLSSLLQLLPIQFRHPRRLLHQSLARKTLR